MTYKKLFNITYNSKEFTIFIDEKNRKTFLELTKEGNYIYPELNDFLYLHNLYNNSDITKISSLPKLSFKEKVRYQALTLSVIALLNLTSCYQKSTVKIEDNNLIISEENIDTKKYLATNSNLDTSNYDKINIITDLKAFDELLGITSIDYETVKELITTSTLPSKFQNSALSILNLINNNAENPELRIFYENLKTLQVHELSLDEIKSIAGSNVEAFYDAKENAIYATPNCSAQVALHEMFHVAHFIYLTKDNTNYYYGFNIENGLVLGKALEEALTNYYLKDIYGLNLTSYDLSGKITDFLLANVPYSYDLYNHYGIRNYLTTLKETYPQIEIDYIINYMDTLNESISHNDTLKITNTMNSLYDQLFNLTKTNLNPNNPYQKLIPFLDMIYKIEGDSNHFYEYFNLYNDYLTQNNIETLALETFKTKYQNLKKIDKYLIFPNSHVEFIFNLVKTSDEKTFTYQTYTKEGNIITKSVASDTCYLNYLPNKADVLATILNYPYETNYETLITNFNRDNTIISPHRYLEVPLIYNNETLTSLNICNNDYDEEVNLYIGLSNDNNLTFKIMQKDNVIFETNKEPKYVSNPIPLSYYLTNFWYENINLNNILNPTYLKEFLKTSNWFKNISLKDDNIVITPLYKVSFTSEEYGTSLIDITDIYISKTSDINSDFYVELTCGYNAPLKIDINPDLISDVVTLKDIMTYYDMLDENVLTYHLTEAEITNLFLNYYANLTENKAR